jgi:ADP-heptose:LPS heptosyltransferase
LNALVQSCAARDIEAKLWIGAADELGVLLGLIAEAKIYFGGDTGPMHMAAALGIPVATVMGGGTYPRFIPLAEKKYVGLNRLDCFGCGWGCRYDRPICIEDQRSPQVIQGIRALL